MTEALRKMRKQAQITEHERQIGFTRMTQDLLASRLDWSTAAHISEI